MLPSGLPEMVADEEDVVRFLTQSSHYTSATVKASAFLPSPTSRETSVLRHGREPIERLRALGLQAAGARALHGAAVLRAEAIRAADLDILADEPPERHAVINRWPWNDDLVLQKAQQKERALALAAAAGEPIRFG